MVRAGAGIVPGRCAGVSAAFPPRASPRTLARGTPGRREERDVSTKAIAELKVRLKAYSCDVTVPGHGAATLRLRKVPTCSGSATLVFVRGKVKPGFDLKVTANWQVDAAAADGSVTVLGQGQLACEELDDVDLGEYEFTVSGETGAAPAECKALVKAALPEVNGVIEAWFQALKAM